eukprot:scaffold125427_cov33-Attheya_sp.AAC.2
MNNLCGIRVSRTERTTHTEKEDSQERRDMNEGRGSEFPMRRMRRMTRPAYRTRSLENDSNAYM